MKRTPLFNIHKASAARIINLKGFARPVEYVGHVEEHRAIRERVSICDVSHMGEIEFTGKDALTLVNKLITNDAARLQVNQALYTVMCNDDGYVIDDLVCLRLGEERFLWVVNVTKTDEDYRWILKHAEDLDVDVRNLSTDLALIALQGPYAGETLQKIAKADLSMMAYYRLTETTVMTQEMEVPCIVSRTGYTGERGYEICVARDLAQYVWQELIRIGRPLGILPHGVAARESARTEAGYLLNGNDMDNCTYPHEVGLDWVVKLESDFIGRDALAQVAEKGVSRKLVGLEIQGHQTIRHGYPILKNGKQIGQVTSGPLSPALLGSSSSLGLGFVESAHAQDNDLLEINARGNLYDARIVSLPFCKRHVREDADVHTLSPYGLRYSAHHLWLREERDGFVTVGLTDFGQHDLGEVLFVNPPDLGDRTIKGSPFGWLDTYRKHFDIIAPVSGRVVTVNASITARPSDLNKFPYVCHGLVQIESNDPCELEDLMQFPTYMDFTRSLERYEIWSQDLRFT